MITIMGIFSKQKGESMGIFDDMKRMIHGGEPPEDNLKYTETDPVFLNCLLSGCCYVVAIIEHKKYLELVLRNLEDQSVYFCLHIYNPTFVKMTAWKAGKNRAKYIIDPTKM